MTGCGQYKKINCGYVDPNCAWTKVGCKKRKSVNKGVVYYGPAGLPYR